MTASALLVEQATSEKLTKASALRAVKEVAAQLGNTPAVSRKCYIQPAILKSFEDEKLLAVFLKASAQKKTEAGLSLEESALLRFLKHKEVKALA